MPRAPTIGSDESDEDGEVFIELPGPGDYVVTLDTETLPDGIELRDPERTSFELDVEPRASASRCCSR